MTTLHPVRSAPPPGTDERSGGAVASTGQVPGGGELLTALLAGTAADEQPVTHVHHLPVRASRG